ncbi:MAG TPA: DMT family transporter [Thermoleophilia bacterium]|nr:DMT family transporter [Thermoleophilia bacterium]
MTSVVSEAGEVVEAGPVRDATAAPRALPRSGFAWALLSGVFWGADGVVLGVALAMTPFIGAAALVAPLAMAALHDGLSTGWMLAFNAATGRLRQLPRSLRSRHGLVLVAAAVIGGPIAMSGYLFGIKYAGPAYTLAISATYPAVGAVLSRIFLRERVTRRGWLGIAVTVAGAVVVTYTPPDGAAPLFYLGIALAAVATLGWGVEGVLAIHAMKAIEPVVAGTLRMATSFVVYLCVVLPLAGGLGVFAAAFGQTSFWIVLGAAAAGAASYLTYYAANHLVGASRAMPLNSLYAVWAIVFSVVLTGLHPSVQLFAGVLITFGGALLVVSSAPRSNGDLAETEAIFPPATR